MHLSRFVKTYGTVKEGGLIGYSGGAKGAEGSGLSTGPHVHWDVRTQYNPTSFKAFINPLSLVKGDDMVTSREDAIALYRKLLKIHSPTKKQQTEWTGRNLPALLDGIVRDERFKKAWGVDEQAIKDKWFNKIKSLFGKE